MLSEHLPELASAVLRIEERPCDYEEEEWTRQDVFITVGIHLPNYGILSIHEISCEIVDTVGIFVLSCVNERDVIREARPLF